MRFNCKTLPLVGLLMIMSGCASVTVPNEQIELARNAVNRAVAAEATQYAPVEMRAAQDKMSALDRALGEKKFEQARTLAEGARADARVAERKAQALKAKEQLEVARKGIEVLKQEILDAPDSPTAKSVH
ncbi:MULTISPECIES: DUF4398 domain-containing protein [Pseudomonas]|uniref:DUF4398 domain-containing protein n=1 Tax=Pseudomonas entomophila TaxID=312306 RepID=A0A3Q8U370_9PSED|nr:MULTISPECIES: DUF4398 domain-containing protein [Pseudomonas]AZL69618.1 DUF4398 domain-containing protein [Pseudomonas oryziphila]UVK81494.1 DUF4398 domain-containing protein [Pseudomonas sichuanensis]